MIVPWGKSQVTQPQRNHGEDRVQETNIAQPNTLVGVDHEVELISGGIQDRLPPIKAKVETQGRLGNLKHFN